jgi:signal peptidase I
MNDLINKTKTYFFPQKKGVIRDTLETVLIAFVLAMIIRTFIVQVFYIPTGSMIPTLLIKDRVIVNKFIYKFSKPKHQEVIVFKYPVNPKKDFIKRIIGIPGDTIVIRNGYIFVNDQKLDEKNHPLNRDNSYYGPLKVPPNSYFVLGDNRYNSADSRVWGFVPKKNIIGKAFFKIWPPLRIGPIP